MASFRGFSEGSREVEMQTINLKGRRRRPKNNVITTKAPLHQPQEDGYYEKFGNFSLTAADSISNASNDNAGRNHNSSANPLNYDVYCANATTVQSERHPDVIKLRDFAHGVVRSKTAIGHVDMIEKFHLSADQVQAHIELKSVRMDGAFLCFLYVQDIIIALGRSRQLVDAEFNAYSVALQRILLSHLCVVKADPTGQWISEGDGPDDGCSKPLPQDLAGEYQSSPRPNGWSSGPNRMSILPAFHPEVVMLRGMASLMNISGTQNQKDLRKLKVAAQKMNMKITLHTTKTGPHSHTCHLVIEKIKIATGFGKRESLAIADACKSGVNEILCPSLCVIQTGQNFKQVGCLMSPSQPAPPRVCGLSTASEVPQSETVGPDCSFIGPDNFILLDHELPLTAWDILRQSAEYNRMSFEYDSSVSGHTHQCTMKLQNKIIANVRDLSSAAAMRAASEQALLKLRKSCWTIRRKAEVDDTLASQISRDDVECELRMQSGNPDSSSPYSNGIGGKGCDDQTSRKDCPSVDQTLSKDYLSLGEAKDQLDDIHPSNIRRLGDLRVSGKSEEVAIPKEKSEEVAIPKEKFREVILSKLLTFLSSISQDDLIIWDEFSADESAVILEECQRCCLEISNKVVGKGKRFIHLQRKRPISELFFHLVFVGGESASYTVVAPVEEEAGGKDRVVRVPRDTAAWNPYSLSGRNEIPSAAAYPENNQKPQLRNNFTHDMEIESSGTALRGTETLRPGCNRAGERDLKLSDAAAKERPRIYEAVKEMSKRDINGPSGNVKEMSKRDINGPSGNVKKTHSLFSLHSIVLFENSAPHSSFQVLQESAVFNKKHLQVTYGSRDRSSIVCHVLLEDRLIASAQGCNQIVARCRASDLALERLKSLCWLIKAKIADSAGVVVTLDDITKKAPEQPKTLGENCVGFQLMKKMGWQGGRLGKNRTGISEPVNHLEGATAGRSGLGFHNNQCQPSAPTFDREKIMYFLQKFAVSEGTQDLLFTMELTDQVKRFIHCQCRKLTLECVKADSKDSVLVVQRKWDKLKLFNYLESVGGETENHRLVAPVGRRESAADDVGNAAADPIIPEREMKMSVC